MKRWMLLMVFVAACLPFFFGTRAALGANADLYSEWDSDLRKYVDGKGAVNYKGWKGDRKGLDFFLQSASRLTAEDYSRMSADEKLVLWINIYNAFTVKQILDHYPIYRSGLNLYPGNSIRQIEGVWDKYKVSTAGRTLSLNDIEHKILRGEFKEPLIHFAINCASRSCPKLVNTAYRSGSIRAQLENAARDFVNDEGRNKIDVGKRAVEISQIFDWFGDDFRARFGVNGFPGRSAKQAAVLNFLVQHLPEGDKKELLQSNKFSLRNLTYDWTLNERGANK